MPLQPNEMVRLLYYRFKEVRNALIDYIGELEEALLQATAFETASGLLKNKAKEIIDDANEKNNGNDDGSLKER